MYDNLVITLRNNADHYMTVEGAAGLVHLLTDAADALEELQQTVEQMKAIVIDEAQHIEMYDERDKKTLIEMAKSLPLQIIPDKGEKPRWISVTERLPEDGQDILAVQSWDGEARIVPANYDRGLWYDCVFDYPAEHITHWMPIPEPPKVEAPAGPYDLLYEEGGPDA